MLSACVSSPRGTSPGSASPASPAELKKITLQAAELPDGWQLTPHHANTVFENRAALLKCTGGRSTDGDKFAGAQSDDFGLDGAVITSEASGFRSPSDLDADKALLSNPRLPGCLAQVTKTSIGATLPAGTLIKSVSFKVTPGSAGGPANVIGTAAGTALTQGKNGVRAPVFLTATFIQGPLIEAEVDTESIADPVPGSVVNPLVDKVAARAVTGIAGPSSPAGCRNCI